MIVDLKLKRLQSRQSSIIHYVECKERVLLCMLVKYFIIIFFFLYLYSSTFFYIHVIYIISYNKYKTNFSFPNLRNNVE